MMNAVCDNARFPLHLRSAQKRSQWLGHQIGRKPLRRGPAMTTPKIGEGCPVNTPDMGMSRKSGSRDGGGRRWALKTKSGTWHGEGWGAGFGSEMAQGWRL